MDNRESANASMSAEGQAGMVASVAEMLKAPAFAYHVVCRDKYGNIRWEETIHNLVTTVGKNFLIDTVFKGSGYTAAWYGGLKGSGSAAAGDTAASHAGWSEVTAYSAGTRPAITFGTTSSGSNTASAINYSMNGAYTVAGLFIISDNTKSGTTGTLYSAGDFAAARSGGSGDTLAVTPTLAVT